MHPQKQFLQNVDKGIDFVGFAARPSHILMRKRIIKNLKEKLWQFNQRQKISQENIKQMLSAVNSYYGQFKHAKTFALREKLWKDNFGKLRNFFQPVDANFSYFQIK